MVKDLDAGEDWRQEKKGAKKDEMVGWHQWLNGYKFEQLWEMMKHSEVWRSEVHGVAESQIWLNDWATTGGPVAETPCF